MSKVVRGLDDKALYAAEVASISFKDVTEAQWEFLEKRKTGKDTTPNADAAERGRSFVKATSFAGNMERSANEHYDYSHKPTLATGVRIRCTGCSEFAYHYTEMFLDRIFQRNSLPGCHYRMETNLA